LLTAEWRRCWSYWRRPAGHLYLSEVHLEVAENISGRNWKYLQCRVS
jgi:hypothetical protein